MKPPPFTVQVLPAAEGTWVVYDPASNNLLAEYADEQAANDMAAELVAHAQPPEPGEDCPRCNRRVPHPRKPSSPKTVTKSYRVPVDEAEAHSEVLETAARFLGCFERPHWQYQLVTLACALVLQDESLKGAAGRQP